MIAFMRKAFQFDIVLPVYFPFTIHALGVTSKQITAKTDVKASSRLCFADIRQGCLLARLVVSRLPASFETRVRLLWFAFSIQPSSRTPLGWEYPTWVKLRSNSCPWMTAKMTTSVGVYIRDFVFHQLADPGATFVPEDSLIVFGRTRMAYSLTRSM